MNDPDKPKRRQKPPVKRPAYPVALSPSDLSWLYLEQKRAMKPKQGTKGPLIVKAAMRQPSSSSPIHKTILRFFKRK